MFKSDWRNLVVSAMSLLIFYASKRGKPSKSDLFFERYGDFIDFFRTRVNFVNFLLAVWPEVNHSRLLRGQGRANWPTEVLPKPLTSVVPGCVS